LGNEKSRIVFGFISLELKLELIVGFEFFICEMGQAGEFFELGLEVFSSEFCGDSNLAFLAGSEGLGSAVGDDLALVDDDDAIGDFSNFGENV
jgi:hypothetical protein